MKILVGMSGGLDSTYCALELIRLGVRVEGAILKMHSYSEEADARASAEALGIPLHVIDCTDAFENTVVDNFISEYKRGRTPNPCIICNSEVKFKYLVDYAMQQGFDGVATGHYARIYAVSPGGERRLRGLADIQSGLPLESGYRLAVGFGEDIRKDQTYMLWRLPEAILSRLVFPLGDKCKADIREEARAAKLIAADRAESQEICFIPDGDYAAFIEERGEPAGEGNFIDEEGKILGRHKGIIRYTVGQRRGLGISASGRLFVKKIDIASNDITLSLTDAEYSRVRISGIRYQGIAEPQAGEEIRLDVKLRYAARPVSCRLTYLGGDSAELLLDTPVRAVTPGQSAVLYTDGVIALGGFIDYAE